MKRTLALILAALLLASSIVSCGKGGTTPNETEGITDKVETNVPATDAVETNAPETDAPAPSYDANLVTENGVAKAHIVLHGDAEQILTYAAEELSYHIKKVSGADISTVNEVQEGSLPIIIATPDSLPELETLFPEDLAWLRTLTEEGTDKRYGDDGFAIRQLDGKLYIFGATGKGALNGVYDFIEDNMGVLWVGADEYLGLIYDEQPTITVAKADYREKSPFTLRGYSLWGGSDEILITEAVYSRNKLNASVYPMDRNPEWCPDYYNRQAALGITGVMLGHDVQEWILASPIYDPNCTEYWNELEDGVPCPVDATMIAKQINYWSQLTIDTMAASVIAYLDKNDVEDVSISVEDNDDCRNYPECTLPFEYAPGEFVNPSDGDYISTVFYTFLNKVAAQVKEKHPDITINTLAYWPVEAMPRCELDDCIRLIFAPITKDESSSLTDPTNDNNVIHFNYLEDWKGRTKEILFYDYYFCSVGMGDYERPIWYDMQKDMIYYAENGFLGPMPQGICDSVNQTIEWGGHSGVVRTRHDGWIMNGLSMWIYHKLCWNPYEDVDALIVEFCDKVYGEASDEMQEYYALIYKGWVEGESETYLWNFKIALSFYLDTFVYVVDLEDDIKDALTRAYEAAESDSVKERIGYIKMCYEQNFPEE